MTYIGQVTNGIGLALLTTSTFPEVVDSIEKRSDYADYDKDEMHLHISGVFVFISALAQLIGVFSGSTIAGLWGYNAAYVFGGCIMVTYGVTYAILCRAGND